MRIACDRFICMKAGIHSSCSRWPVEPGGLRMISKSKRGTKTAYRAYRFEQRGDVQNGGFGLPRANNLHVDWHPFLTRTESHRQARQASYVKRHRRAL